MQNQYKNLDDNAYVGEKMNMERVIVMDYVYKHPYRSIVDIADALNMSITTIEEIVNELHNDCKVYIIRDHFVPMHGFVPYDSPLVEPETDYK